AFIICGNYIQHKETYNTRSNENVAYTPIAIGNSTEGHSLRGSCPFFPATYGGYEPESAGVIGRQIAPLIAWRGLER
ncbi:hypothetical protein BaRGS_00032306, partial [Batillaria attramentaria]